MKTNTKLILTTLALSLPSLAYAQEIATGSLATFIDSITRIIGTRLIPLLLTLALAVFFYRIVISIYKVGDNPKAVAEGKTLLFWGIVALFVMVSIWGITAIISNTFGITQVVPQLGSR